MLNAENLLTASVSPIVDLIDYTIEYNNPTFSSILYIALYEPPPSQGPYFVNLGLVYISYDIDSIYIENSEDYWQDIAGGFTAKIMEFCKTKSIRGGGSFIPLLYR